MGRHPLSDGVLTAACTGYVLPKTIIYDKADFVERFLLFGHDTLTAQSLSIIIINSSYTKGRNFVWRG